MAAIHEDMDVATVVVLHPDLFEDLIGGLLRLGAGVAGLGATGIAWIIPDQIGDTQETIIHWHFDVVITTQVAGRPHIHLTAMPWTACERRPHVVDHPVVVIDEGAVQH